MLWRFSPILSRTSIKNSLPCWYFVRLHRKKIKLTFWSRLPPYHLELLMEQQTHVYFCSNCWHLKREECSTLLEQCMFKRYTHQKYRKTTEMMSLTQTTKGKMFYPTQVGRRQTKKRRKRALACGRGRMAKKAKNSPGCLPAPAVTTAPYPMVPAVVGHRRSSTCQNQRWVWANVTQRSQLTAILGKASMKKTQTCKKKKLENEQRKCLTAS